MIKDSIYRQGGTCNWMSTFGQVKDIFKKAKTQDSFVVITAGDKGYGKSTVFEHLSKFAPEISMEGDILSVLAASVIDGRDLDDNWTMGDIANGKAIPGFIPWTVTVKEGVDKDQAYKEALVSLLGKDFMSKLSLCTAFHGCEADAVIVVVPDHGAYKKNMDRRTKHMTEDQTKSKEWRSHIAKHHKSLSWPEFHQRLVEKEASRKVKRSKPYLYLPNVSPETLGNMAEITCLSAILAGAATLKVQTKPWLNWTLPCVGDKNDSLQSQSDRQ